MEQPDDGACVDGVTGWFACFKSAAIDSPSCLRGDSFSGEETTAMTSISFDKLRNSLPSKACTAGSAEVGPIITEHYETSKQRGFTQKLVVAREKWLRVSYFEFELDLLVEAFPCARSLSDPFPKFKHANIELPSRNEQATTCIPCTKVFDIKAGCKKSENG